MLSLLIGIFTFVLIIICFLLVIVILMQRPSADAGMGASLAGGAAESAFGGETGNVLTRACVRFIVIFFVLTFSLYLANIYLNDSEDDSSASAGTAMESTLNKLDGEKPAATEAEKAKAEADKAKAAAEEKAEAGKAAEEAKSKADAAKSDAANAVESKAANAPAK